LLTNFKKNTKPYKIAATGRGGARAHTFPGKTKQRRPLTQKGSRKETEGAMPLLHSWSAGASGEPHEHSLFPLLTYTLHCSAVDTKPRRAGRLRGSLERSRGERRGQPRGRSYPVGSPSTAEGGRARRIERHPMAKKTVERCP
jgi:hypothetical protein